MYFLSRAGYYYYIPLPHGYDVTISSNLSILPILLVSDGRPAVLASSPGVLAREETDTDTFQPKIYSIFFLALSFSDAESRMN